MKNEIKNEKNNMTTRMARLAMSMSTAFGAFMYMGFYSCAADLGKNSANWFLNQIFWVGVIVLVIALVGCIIKKAWVQGIIVFIVGVVILYLIKNPDVFETVGAQIGKLIFGQGGGSDGK